MGACCAGRDSPAPNSGRILGTASLSDEILKKYDTNGDGVLNAGEFQALLKDCFPDDDVKEEDMGTMMKCLDLNHDGTIGVNEVRALMRCLNPKTHKIERRSALIIIDVQNDFVSGSLKNPYNAVEIVPVINGFRDKFDVVVVSYDWHPQNHCSFVESANDQKVAIKDSKETYEAFSLVTLQADADRPEHQQMLYPRHAVQKSEGGALPPDLVKKDSDLEVFKGTRANIDSYSAFFDNMKANDTGLTAMLEKEGVTDIYCCGLVTDICVKSTALHGAEGGFLVSVIEDASRPLDESNMPETKKQLAEAGVALLSAAEAVEHVAAIRKVEGIREYMAGVKKLTGAKQVHNAIEMGVGAHKPHD